MSSPVTVLITGGSSGIGRAAVCVLARQGWRTAYTYRSSAGAQETRALLRTEGLDARPLRCDLNDLEETHRMVEGLAEDWGGIDALLHCAAISNTKAVEEIDEAEWDTMLDTNLKASFFLLQHTFLLMRKRGGGRIVCLTSIAGERGGQHAGIHYSASKGGLTAMVKSFALAGAPHAITVNALAPGVVETPMSREEGLTPAGIPLGRMASPEEVAQAAAFLLSPGAAYITGTTLDVNGGMMMR